MLPSILEQRFSDLNLLAQPNPAWVKFMGRTEGEGGEEGVCETREVWETIQSEVRDSSWLLHPFTYRASSSRRTKPHRPMLAILRCVDKGHQSWTKVPARVAHKVRGPKRRASKVQDLRHRFGVDINEGKSQNAYILYTIYIFRGCGKPSLFYSSTSNANSGVGFFCCMLW